MAKKNVNNEFPDKIDPFFNFHNIDLYDELYDRINASFAELVDCSHVPDKVLEMEYRGLEEALRRGRKEADKKNRKDQRYYKKRYAAQQKAKKREEAEQRRKLKQFEKQYKKALAREQKSSKPKKKNGKAAGLTFISQNP